MRNALTLAIATLAAAAGLMAQPGPGGPRPGRGTPPAPAEMVERRVQMLTTRLELTAAQQAQAKTIFTEEANAIQALSSKWTEARDAMEKAVKTTGLDADIERAAAALGALETQTATIRGKAQAKFRAILTPDQKTKLDSMEEGGRGMGPGRMGGFGRRD